MEAKQPARLQTLPCPSNAATMASAERTLRALLVTSGMGLCTECALKNDAGTG